MHAAVVELDALADAVRARAEDHDALGRAGRRLLVALAPGRVEVVRAGCDLAGARIDPAEHGRRRYLARFLGCQRRELALEERVQSVGLPLEVAFEAALRLDERLEERPTDPHRLAHRLHLGAERRVGAGELLEREARDLHDHVVERRLEARRGRPGQVVRDLVERVADRELRRHLRDWIAGRLGRERRRPRDAGVHLDHPQLTRHAAARELDVRTAGVDADRADDADRRVAQLLVRIVAERHLRRDGDRVTGVDAHRIEVLDRADDHDVVGSVAHDLELELVPAAHRLLDEHLRDRRLGQAAQDLAVQLLGRVGEAAAVTAERERRADDGGQRDPVQIVARGDDARRRHLEAAAFDRLLEELAIFRTLNRLDPRADQLDPELAQDPVRVELARQVERGAAAHRRQQGIRALAPQHPDDAFEIERLEVRAVGKARVGHDRRRVRVDDDRAISVLPQHLQRLAACVVELGRLPDHDRPGADQADRVKIVSARHQASPQVVDPARDDRRCVVRARRRLGMELRRACP